VKAHAPLPVGVPPAEAADLSLKIGRLTLKNPVGTASGTYGKGIEFLPFYDTSRLGCVVVKTITMLPRPGNPPPRLVETAGGLLNSIGLPNPGVEGLHRDELPKLRTLGAPLVINIAGHDAAEFATLAARLERESGIDALELNMSCPNVSGGLDFSASPEAARDVVRRVRDVTERPLIAKLSPNVTDIRPIAVAAQEAGADAVSAINTFVGMAIDWRARAPVLGRGLGGLSGPAINRWRCASCGSSRVAIPSWASAGGGGRRHGSVAGASAVRGGKYTRARPCCGGPPALRRVGRARRAWWAPEDAGVDPPALRALPGKGGRRPVRCYPPALPPQGRPRR
jgi:dihydroorotate dehydrogenase (NAD+) catalytic subunit